MVPDTFILFTLQNRKLQTRFSVTGNGTRLCFIRKGSYGSFLHWLVCYVLLSLVLSGTSCSIKKDLSEFHVPTTSAVEGSPVIAIYVNPGMPAPLSFTGDREECNTVEHVKMIVAIWNDGTIIVSDDLVEGGKPYFMAKILAEDVVSLFSKMSGEKVFESPTQWFNTGPDSSYTTIYIKRDDSELLFESWHELVEQNPNLVCTSEGIELLDNKTRDEVLASQPRPYKLRRNKWTQIKKLVIEALPENKNPVVEDIQFEICREN